MFLADLVKQLLGRLFSASSADRPDSLLDRLGQCGGLNAKAKQVAHSQIHHWALMRSKAEPCTFEAALSLVEGELVEKCGTLTAAGMILDALNDYKVYFQRFDELLVYCDEVLAIARHSGEKDPDRLAYYATNTIAHQALHQMFATAG